MGVAARGDVTPPGRAAAGVLARGQPAEPHELGCGANRRPSPTSQAKVRAPRRVTPGRRPDGGARHRRMVAGRTSWSGRPRWRPGRRLGPAGWPGSGRRSWPAPGRRSAGRSATARARRSRCCRLARCGRGATRSHQAQPSPGPVGHQVGSGPAQVSDGLFGDGRHADGHQLAGAVQPGQPPAVAAVGLDPVPGGGGDQRGRDHRTANVHAVQQPGQLVTGGAGLVAGPQPSGIWELRQEPADRGSSLAIRSTSGVLRLGLRTATEIVSRCTSRPR
jgi:hypothetical protein